MSEANDPNTKSLREWKPDFLAAYKDRGSVKDACAVAKIGRTTAYEARVRDPEFAAAWDAIEHNVVKLLEESALQRAQEGSERMIEFLLKAHRPTMYRDTLRIDGKLAIASEAQLDEEIGEFLARRDEELVAAGEGEAAGATGLRGVGDEDRAPSAASTRAMD